MSTKYNNNTIYTNKIWRMKYEYQLIMFYIAQFIFSSNKYAVIMI